MSNSDPVLGTLQTLNEFPSRFVASRRIDIWLPPSYSSDEPLPVIYMHDGQNLFIPELSYTEIDWGIDEAIVTLQLERGIGPAIVVGVWNTSLRWPEYMPQKALELPGREAVKQRFLDEAGQLPISDNYLRFLVEEVKPYVDAHFATKPEKEHTFIMGSSMGGLISLYAVCEYPRVFGGAGCLSTHWPAGHGVVVDYLRLHLPAAGRHKFYFDYGSVGFEAHYAADQARADEALRVAGLVEGEDWITLFFEGADHSERAWRERVSIPLAFLLAEQN